MRLGIPSSVVLARRFKGVPSDHAIVEHWRKGGPQVNSFTCFGKKRVYG